MNVNAPHWLFAGVAACLALIALWFHHDRRQRIDLGRIVSLPLRERLTRSVSVARRRLRRALLMLALALLFTAMAGPELGFRWEEITRRGNDVVFAIDTSRSMLTPDVTPNRLTRAKLAIEDIASQLDGDALGIVAFAGNAFLACPITLDYSAFHQSLTAIDTQTIARGGTNLSLAIRKAQEALRRRPGAEKLLILITDGEDLEGNALDAARAAAQQDHIKIFTVGVGTAAGELVPVPADQGGGYVKDDAGMPVRSRLDEAALRAIATVGGGAYASQGSAGQSVEETFRSAFNALAKHDLASRRQKIYTQRYQWPLAASLVLLLVSMLIGQRRSMNRRLGIAPLTAFAAAALMLPASPRSADAASQPDARPPAQRFKAGTSAYRSGEFPAATRAFQDSIRAAPSADAQRLKEQQDAYYNLGNALYRTGQKTEKSTPQATREQWRNAIKAYDTALQLRPDDADSRYNRDFVQRKLDELNQNPPPPPPSGSPPPGSPPPGAPPPGGSPPGGSPPGANPPPRGTPPAEPQRNPGSMSEEEAQQLLDSAKGEERPGLRALGGQKSGGKPPDKAYKDW